MAAVSCLHLLLAPPLRQEVERNRGGKTTNKMKKLKPEWNHLTDRVIKPWVSGIICPDNCPACDMLPKTKHQSSISSSIWCFISSSQLHMKNKGTGINFRCVPLWFMLSRSMPATLMAFYRCLHTPLAHPTLARLERNEEELRGWVRRLGCVCVCKCVCEGGKKKPCVLQEAYCSSSSWLSSHFCLTHTPARAHALTHSLTS